MAVPDLWIFGRTCHWFCGAQSEGSPRFDIECSRGAFVSSIDSISGVIGHILASSNEPGGGGEKARESGILHHRRSPDWGGPGRCVSARNGLLPGSPISLCHRQRNALDDR